MPCSRSQIRIRDDGMSRCKIDHRGLNWLDPQSVGATMKPNLEGRPGLTGAGTKPTSQQIWQLIARRSRGTGDVAELLREPELPHRSIRKPYIGLTLGKASPVPRWELQ